VWAAAGEHAPNHATTAATAVVMDLDATLVPSHSEKDAAMPTFKRGFDSSPRPCVMVRVPRPRCGWDGGDGRAGAHPSQQVRFETVSPKVASTGAPS